MNVKSFKIDGNDLCLYTYKFYSHYKTNRCIYIIIINIDFYKIL